MELSIADNGARQATLQWGENQTFLVFKGLWLRYRRPLIYEASPEVFSESGCTICMESNNDISLSSQSELKAKEYVHLHKNALSNSKIGLPRD